MQNYFNYFTEIEERFQQRRGSLLMLSTLDWALIETWREAGVPLEAVLRGIDNAFDKHDAKALRSSGRTRKVNGLAWCAQSVMEAVEQAMEASIGAAPAAGSEASRERLRDRTGQPVSGTECRLPSRRQNCILQRTPWPLKSPAGCGPWPLGLRAEPAAVA